MTSKLDVSKTWFQRVWHEEDEAAIDDMLVVDTKAKGLGSEDLIGPEGFKMFHRALLGRTKDVDIEVARYMEDGDWISLLVVLRAKRRDTGAPVEMTGNVYVKIVDGKLVEGHNHFDFIRLFEQLELMPAKSMETCLVGEKIG